MIKKTDCNELIIQSTNLKILLGLKNLNIIFTTTVLFLSEEAILPNWKLRGSQEV
tara:strand:+ start:471 stop:635 length:165 start_codon:yes stop_codon:yes gene_type:complete